MRLGEPGADELACWQGLGSGEAAAPGRRAARTILVFRVPNGYLRAETLRARLAKERGSSAPGASTLTAAELRLLPLLSTHLSMPEIAGELFLSRNTIKSQAISIYRKLGTSSRNQAVTRSRELGLMEG